ncbi:MAG TPA: GNAT family N-acetyltransferase, partial [Gemmatimonadales bacterium]|nr:GNAT family N-acetyltransferase [Gemmatimonadales bacterium]
HPHYARLFAKPGDRVICAASRTATGGILYPLILRPFSAEPWAGDDARGCDLTTPYGYGGPYAWNVPDRQAPAFWAAFETWARARGAVTAFARLSLFPEQLISFHGDVVDRGPNVVRTLELADDELWSAYDSKVRKNVKRAQREGVVVEFDETGKRLDAFVEIYEATMNRREALSQYYFPRSFFESIRSDLAGQYVYAHAVAGGRVVSSELVLLSVHNSYFLLGGTLESAFSLRPSDLIQHEIFRYCRDRGMKRCVLGGGYRPDDGILRFKRSFAPGGDRPFRVGVTTYDRPASQRLVESRRAWERAQGREWNPAEGFFPPYRS